MPRWLQAWLWRRRQRTMPSDTPVRWALIFSGDLFPVPVIRKITEDRIPYWTAVGWTVFARDSDLRFLDVEDVRREDEKGHR